MSDGTLRQGESSPAIRNLQEDLNKLGITDERGRTLTADGVFGRSTREAVENFQLWSNKSLREDWTIRAVAGR